MRKHTRLPCVHILAYACRRNSAVPYAYYYLSRLAHRDDDIKVSWPTSTFDFHI